MKRATLMDNAAGNELGWNPDGVTTQFSITDLDILTIDGSYIDASVEFTGNLVWIVSAHNGQSFSLACITAPPEESELHYVVEHLPAHTP